MTKQEFLNKLSHEELLILRDIMSCEITRELNKRNTKTPIEVKVGDCFVYKNDCNDIFLTKVVNCAPSDYYFEKSFDCEEISIDSNDIDIYKVNYHTSDFSEYNRIDSEIFDKIATLVNSRDDTVDKIREEFNKQIRELCQELK